MLPLCAAVFGLVAALYVGTILSAPIPREIGLLPPDLKGEETRIPSESGSTLATWVIPGTEGGGVVVLMHGVRGNRRAMLSRARFLSKAGYGVVLFGFQAHDESPGESITFGYLESRDAAAAVQFARERFPGEAIGVLGTSMGGAAALLARPPLKVDAAVLEMVYPTLDEAIANRLKMRLGSAGAWLTPLFSVQLKLRQGISSSELRPIEHVRDLNCPKLVIAGEADKHTTLAESQRLFDAAREPKELWVVQGASHQDLHALIGEIYEEKILNFFATHLRKVSDEAGSQCNFRDAIGSTLFGRD